MSLPTTIHRRLAHPARALICGVLCALAFAAVHAATSPEPAQAAKFTTGYVTGTIYFSKGETAVAARGEAWVCAALPRPASIACTLAIGPVSWQARRARDKGMCLKIKFVMPDPRQYWPDIYGGGYCR